MIKPKKRLNS